MRILIFNSSYPAMKCGVGDYTARLAAALASMPKNRVTVLTSEHPDVIRSSTDNVRILPIAKDWGWKQFFWHYPRLIRALPDIVITGYPSLMAGPRSELTFWLPTLCRVFLPISDIVFIVHEFSRTHASAREELKRAFASSDRIFVIDPADRDLIAGENPRVTERIATLASGSTIDVAPTSAYEIEGFRRNVAPNDESILFYFGFLHPEKGVDDLLEALRLVKTEDVVLVLGCELQEGNTYHQAVEERIERLGLVTKVKVLGFLSEASVSRWLQSADAVVLPFRTGASPSRTTFLAAIAHGAAVISTVSTRMPTFLEKERSARLVPPLNPSSLAAAIDEVLSSETVRDGLRGGAIEASRRLEWPAIADDLLAQVQGL